MTIDAKVAQALLEEFQESQIYHDDVPEEGTYPMVCYTDLTEQPVLHADNVLYGREHVIRVTIVTFGNSGINELKDKVQNCMTRAGFMWRDTNKTREGKEYYTALDFSIGVKETTT